MAHRDLTTGAAFILHPETQVIDADQAARRLAALPKPVLCTALASDNAILLRCEQITDPALREQHRKAVSIALKMHCGAIRAMNAGGSRNPKVLVYGYLDSVVVPLSVLEMWFHEYRILPRAMAVRSGTGIARAKGASAVVDFGQGEIDTDDDSEKTSWGEA